MRKTLLAAALVLALCCNALAGEMSTPPAPQPPYITAQEPTSGETVNGEMPTPPGISDSLTQIAITLLASVLP